MKIKNRPLLKPPEKVFQSARVRKEFWNEKLSNKFKFKINLNSKQKFKKETGVVQTISFGLRPNH